MTVRDTERSASAPEPRDRLPYTQPTIERLGSMAELTATSPNSTGSDGAGPYGANAPVS